MHSFPTTALCSGWGLGQRNTFVLFFRRLIAAVVYWCVWSHYTLDPVALLKYLNCCYNSQIHAFMESSFSLKKRVCCSIIEPSGWLQSRSSVEPNIVWTLSDNFMNFITNKIGAITINMCVRAHSYKTVHWSLINALILNMLDLSPLSPAQAVKVVSLTKLSADPAVWDNYTIISNLPCFPSHFYE